MTAPRFDWLGTYIAGVKHHVGVNTLLMLRHGLVLSLHPEANEYDPFAVRIDGNPNVAATHCKFGYIPMSQSAMVRSLIEHGYDLGCVVDYVDPAKFEVCVSLTLPDYSDL